MNIYQHLLLLQAVASANQHLPLALFPDTAVRKPEPVDPSILSLEDNPGLHSFSFHGAFADDISYAKMSLKLNTKRMVKTVEKATSTMTSKLQAPSPFLKLLGHRLLQSVQPATDRLRTLDAILYQQGRNKRGLAGIAALAAAGYAIYDIRQLRGDLGQVAKQQHAVEATLRTASKEMDILNLAATHTRIALKSVLSNVSDIEQLLQMQILAESITEFCNSAATGLDSVLKHQLSPSLVPETTLSEDFAQLVQTAKDLHLTPVIRDHKQVYQLTAYFNARTGKPLEVFVRIPLKPDHDHMMYTLFTHKSLPTLNGDRVVRIRGHKNILAVGPTATRFSELSEADLQACTNLGHTYLCDFRHTWTSDPTTSCLGAIYFQDAHAIQLRCDVRIEPARFLLERLNETAFVSVAMNTTTAQVQCGKRRTIAQLHGTQVGNLAHSCSIAAGQSAMTSSPTSPPDSSFQVRIIPQGLSEDLTDWSNNKLLADLIDGINADSQLDLLQEQVANLTRTSVAVRDLAAARSWGVAAALTVPALFLLLTVAIAVTSFIFRRRLMAAVKRCLNSGQASTRKSPSYRLRFSRRKPQNQTYTVFPEFPPPIRHSHRLSDVSEFPPPPEIQISTPTPSPRPRANQASFFETSPVQPAADTWPDRVATPDQAEHASANQSLISRTSSIDTLREGTLRQRILGRQLMGELLDRFEPNTEDVPLTAAAAEEHQDPAAAVIQPETPAAAEVTTILTAAEVHPEPTTLPAAAVTPPENPAAAVNPAQTPAAAEQSEDQAIAEANQNHHE